MKIFATSLNNHNKLGIYVQNNQLSCLDIVSSVDDADYIFIYIQSRKDFDFQTNVFDEILKSDQPVVIMDYMEFTARDWHTREYLYCDKLYGFKFGTINKNVHKEIFDAISLLNDSNRIKCYFLREMSTLYDYSKIQVPVYPIDFCLNIENGVTDDIDSFINRPIELIYNWGSTNFDRPILHYNLYKLAIENEYVVAETEYQLNKFLENNEPNIFALLHRNPGERIDVNKYLSKSKLVIDVGGHGIKCFRNVESAIKAASTKHICNTQFAYPWIDKINCIELKVDENNYLKLDETLESILYYLNNYQELYNIYKNGVETANKYTSHRYIEDYVFTKLR